MLVVVACALVYIAVQRGVDPGLAVTSLVGAIVLIVVAVGLSMGQTLKTLDIGIGNAKLAFQYYERIQSSSEAIKPRNLDINVKAERESVVQEMYPLPGQNAPRFSAITPANSDDLLVRPSAYPMTPMYLLDNAFRILDWNEAFTIVFDRTMEGRKGRSVVEWTYFLDNFKEVIAHGSQKFGDPQNLPLVDVETIEYTSLRYGKLNAIKRAYQIPDDTGACLAWLVTLDLKYSEPGQQAAFHRDLVRELGRDLMWSEYAMSYDRVLNGTRVYPKLLERLIGGYDGVGEISQDARILDLGAGTGNLTHKLITTGRDRVIFAAENNRIMLEFLRSKCQRFLRSDDESGGVIAFKQDITKLFGIDDDSFDYTILNNVLYAVQDAEACLKEACRVLKRGGELRLTGPRKDSDLNVLFAQIMKELKDMGRFDELEADYRHVQQINELKLSPMLYRWSTRDVETMLLDAGFSKISYSSDDAYAGQAMLVCAVK